MPRANGTRRFGKIGDEIRFRVLVEQMRDEAQRVMTDHDALRERMLQTRKDLAASLTSLSNGMSLDKKTLQRLAQVAEALGQVSPRANRLGWDIAEHSRKISLLQEELVRLGGRFRK